MSSFFRNNVVWCTKCPLHCQSQLFFPPHFYSTYSTNQSVINNSLLALLKRNRISPTDYADFNGIIPGVALDVRASHLTHRFRHQDSDFKQHFKHQFPVSFYPMLQRYHLVTNSVSTVITQNCNFAYLSDFPQTMNSWRAGNRF